MREAPPINRAIVAVVVLAACPRAATRVVEPPIAVPAEGISIAMYIASTSSAPGSLVDDRRWLEVTAGTITLDRIDPSADLPALLVEALDRQPLSLGTCTRERIDRTAKGAPADGLAKLTPVRQQAPKRLPETAPRTPPPANIVSPLVRCRVAGAPGRRFVRVLHVAPSIVYRINHTVMVSDKEGDDDQAIVTTRFAIATPKWIGQRAQVALHDRPPGGELTSRMIAHGTIVLDGGTAVLVNPERTLRARVRSVFDGAIRDPAVPVTDPAWGRESKRAVSTVLDLDTIQLPAGPFDVRITSAAGTRDVVLAATEVEKLGPGLRLPLWVDDALHGVRRNFPETFSTPTGRKIIQRLQLSVANSSDVPREVWVEERLRPARRRDIRGVHPKLTIADHIASMQVVVPPRSTQQMTLTITYDM